MKRLIIVVLAGLFVLTGCGGNAGGGSSELSYTSWEYEIDEESEGLTFYQKQRISFTNQNVEFTAEMSMSSEGDELSLSLTSSGTYKYNEGEITGSLLIEDFIMTIITDGVTTKFSSEDGDSIEEIEGVVLPIDNETTPFTAVLDNNTLIVTFESGESMPFTKVQ